MCVCVQGATAAPRTIESFAPVKRVFVGNLSFKVTKVLVVVIVTVTVVVTVVVNVFFRLKSKH